MISGPPSLSMKVVKAIAEREEVEITELDKPLRTVIDPEALDRLFKQSSGRVIFDYHGYEVIVDHSGHVELVPLDQP